MPSHKITVAVLGSFDTWSYMRYVAEQVAEADCIAHTSRFVYSKNNETGEVGKEPFEIDIDVPMIELLQKKLVAKSDKAIIIYSVPAGHYNEAHWCAEQRKPTLAITFVRGVKVTGIGEQELENCTKLHVSSDESYSACSAVAPWTAWHCVGSKSCPFKKQGTSLNQIEYFITNHDFMWLLAIERLQEIGKLVASFLNGTLPRHRSLESP